VSSVQVITLIMRSCAKAQVSPVRSSNRQRGGKPVSLESLSWDGSMTSGVPKKSRTCCQADGTLFDGLLDCGRDLECQQARCVRSAKIQDPAQGVGRGRSAERFALSVPPMSDFSRILSAIEQGDPKAAEQLLPLVYDELRKLAAAKLARENAGQTLQATALVHEAYLRLVDVGNSPHWNSRGHFFAAAAEAMRRILVEQARRKKRPKHGGDRRRIDLDDALDVAEAPSDDLLALDEVLGRLEAMDRVAAQVVKLHFFTGLSMPETAEALGLSLRSAERNWTYARTWLHRELSRDNPTDAHHHEA
jgi:RNA polymerase sigma factor (TIGR02999 family)